MIAAGQRPDETSGSSFEFEIKKNARMFWRYLIYPALVVYCERDLPVWHLFPDGEV